jgi:hypothetical protein
VGADGEIELRLQRKCDQMPDVNFDPRGET